MDLSDDPIAPIVQDLRSRGFIHTFTIQDSAIYCSELEKEMPAETLTIVEQHEVSGPEADAANTHKIYGVANILNKIHLITSELNITPYENLSKEIAGNIP